MKKFNLTFKGKISPEHDPGQVKAGLADFLSITDPKRINALFDGETVVLRDNLDRKTAAEYFMRLKELGAEVALATAIDISDPPGTESAHSPGGESHKEKPGPGMAEIRREGNGVIDQSWPVSSAHRNNRPVQTAKPAQRSEPAAKQAVNRENYNSLTRNHQPREDSDERRDKLRSMVEKAAAMELSRLDKKIVSIENQAALETSRFLKTEDELRANALQLRTRLESDLQQLEDSAGRDLSNLKNLKAAMEQDCDKQKALLLYEQQDHDQQLAAELQRIQTAGRESLGKAKYEIAQIRKSQEQTRVCLGEDLARLEKLMEASKQQASADLLELETLASRLETQIDNEESDIQRSESEARKAHQLGADARDKLTAKAEQIRDKELERLNRMQQKAKRDSTAKINALNQQIASAMGEKNEAIQNLQELRNNTKRQAEREQSHLYGLQKTIEQRKRSQLETLQPTNRSR